MSDDSLSSSSGGQLGNVISLSELSSSVLFSRTEPGLSVHTETNDTTQYDTDFDSESSAHSVLTAETENSSDFASLTTATKTRTSVTNTSDRYSSSSFESESEDDVTYSSSFVSSDADSEEEHQAEEGFCNKKIQQLKMPIRIPKKTKKKKKKESIEQTTYCNKKIGAIRSQIPGRNPVSQRLHYPSVFDENIPLPVNVRVLEKLKAEDIVQCLHQANQQEFHVPRKCKSCRRKMASLARQQFVREKITKLETQSIERRIDQQVYGVDSLALIGNIMNTLPTLRDKPHEVWKRLTEPLKSKDQEVIT